MATATATEYTEQQLSAFLGRPNARAEIMARLDNLERRLGMKAFRHKHADYRRKAIQLNHLLTIELNPPAAR